MNTHTPNRNRLATALVLILVLGAGLTIYAGSRGIFSGIATAEATSLALGPDNGNMPALSEEQIATAIEREIYLPRLPEPVSVYDTRENGSGRMETAEGLKIYQLIYPREECNIRAHNAKGMSIAMNKTDCL